jgi:hypothetical protein
MVLMPPHYALMKLDQDCHHAWSQGVAARTAYNFKQDRRPCAYILGVIIGLLLQFQH